MSVIYFDHITNSLKAKAYLNLRSRVVLLCICCHVDTLHISQVIDRKMCIRQKSRTFDLAALSILTTNTLTLIRPVGLFSLWVGILQFAFAAETDLHTRYISPTQPAIMRSICYSTNK